MEALALRHQFLLADFLCRAGVRVVTSLRTQEDASCVSVGDRLWALFPHQPGRRGNAHSPQDRAQLVALQGRWIAGVERIRAVPEWDLILRTAPRYRQRKSWAWAVPLDRVPQFAAEQLITGSARTALRPADKDAVLPVLDSVETAFSPLQELFTRQHIAQRPPTFTHGDFVATNLLIQEKTAWVLDLDCYSYEPRACDFARTLSHWKRKLSEQELRTLARVFQSRARLAKEELEVIPLLICAYELYYAVMHVFLFIEEIGTEDAARTLTAIQEEAQAITRYHKERNQILSLVMVTESRFDEG